MPDSNSIINLGNFAKPADTLIKKVSNAVGGIFEPWQIRRVAQAQAEADKIQAVSEIEISDLRYRALQRLVIEEAKKQSNIEEITQKALPEVNEQAKPENMEDDWITNFFDKCRLISDKKMQSLWSKVLAGEANSPGKYSKRTVNSLSTLDKSDAELFCKLCSFGFNITDAANISVLVYDDSHSIYKNNNINFSTLSHLESIGLIKFTSLTNFLISELNQQLGVFSYFNLTIAVEFPKTDNNELNLGKVILTKTGQELAPICGSTPIDGFVEYVKEMWKGFGYKIISDTKQSTQP